MGKIKLTEFSPGAGCGCKIAPKELDKILKCSKSKLIFKNLLVGNDSKDDAAVFDIGDGRAIISTTDFFTPIVDDAYDFGQIASVNAISDIYAMGGQPIMAIAILGWPISKLGSDLAGKVIEGARAICEDEKIPLAGGHSIDISDPIFGLAVTGIIEKKYLKKNNSSNEEDILYLSKKLGVGILTTAEKRGILKPEDRLAAINSMKKVNSIGGKLSKLSYVNAMTDVTGFGLLGHLIEMCGKNLTAEINISKIPILENINYYIEQNSLPGGIKRNLESYGSHISKVDSNVLNVLSDPQTSGGLLISIDKNSKIEFKDWCKINDTTLFEIGKLLPKAHSDKTIIKFK